MSSCDSVLSLVFVLLGLAWFCCVTGGVWFGVFDGFVVVGDGGDDSGDGGWGLAFGFKCVKGNVWSISSITKGALCLISSAMRGTMTIFE